jgi:hypothetical protein
MALQPQDKFAFQKPVFTLSLDFELMWGTRDRPYSEKFRKICQTERDEVIDRLLQLFCRYRISASWGIVGKLFVEQNPQDPLLTAGDLIRKIRACSVPQEIGSHTLSHTVMRGATRATAEREIGECVRIARAAGLKLESLIFPRNCVGHLEVAKRFGFTSYRGPEPHWYAAWPRLLRRIGHMLDILSARTPPPVSPVDEDGIWNIPGSMLYTPSFGARRLVPVWLRVLRAQRGIDAALAANRIFHLWFHPTDIVCRMDAMFEGLRQILARVADLRDRGRLQVLTMREIVRLGSNAERKRENVSALLGA